MEGLGKPVIVQPHRVVDIFTVVREVAGMCGLCCRSDGALCISVVAQRYHGNILYGESGFTPELRDLLAGGNSDEEGVRRDVQEA